MKTLKSLLTISTVLLISACSGGSDSSPPTLGALPPASIGVSGVVLDGPVSGGTLYIYSADDIEAALESADGAEDRVAALNSANPMETIALGDSGDGSYSANLSGFEEGNAVFLVFDNAGAEDQTFGDEPFNMESVAVLGAAGSSNTINVTPHTTVVATQVREALPLDAGGVSNEITAANMNVVSALGEDQAGNELLPDGTDVISETDVELLTEAATDLGAFVRATSVSTGLEQEDVLEAIAHDAQDGEIDGSSPSAAADADALEAVNDVFSLGDADDQEIVIGSCASTATLLWRACDIDIMDDYLEGVAICQDGDPEALEDCVAEAAEERDETQEECGDIYEARLAVCQDLDDEVHEPVFGEAFADSFIDPTEIGDGEDPNPYFPLVAGNTWVYESTFIDEDEGEEVTETTTVTVTNKTKLIQGIDCQVVNDIVEVDGEIVEDTDDWFAQDEDGNVWYCGEIAQNFEFFDGDEPELPELVDIDGSWKAGRDGAKAGILVPADPEIGDVIRNEILYGEAEDVIEVLSVTGNESTEVADCDGECLVVKEFTPLEPDAEENTYYAPGMGVILEVDLESGARAELISFENIPPALTLADAKMLVEHNSTDDDTGFQGFADAEPWNELTITDAEGALILTAEAGGGLMDFGLTEFFFETSEPEAAEVPMEEVLARLPEGTYSFSGEIVDEGPAGLTTVFSHDVPAGPALVNPEEDAEGVDAADLVIMWNEVEVDVDGEEIEIVGYQVIVEEEALPFDADGFAEPVMSVYLSDDATSVTVPVEFIKTDGCYKYEVLAIEETGNQSISEASFTTGGGCEEVEEEEAEGLKDAKILIEHNATDEDTGFQGFADGDPWNELTITDPDGTEVLSVEASGGLEDFGLTELFYETSEPENAEVPITDVLSRMPEGTYTLTAEIVDGDESEITATFTHDIPMGPVLLTPEEDAEDVDPENTVVSWEPVTLDLDGDPITIVGYQVIVEKDVEPAEFPTGFAQPVFSVFLPPTTTSITIPAEFMEEESEYEYEVLAIEDSGNQAISSAGFETE